MWQGQSLGGAHLVSSLPPSSVFGRVPPVCKMERPCAFPDAAAREGGGGLRGPSETWGMEGTAELPALSCTIPVVPTSSPLSLCSLQTDPAEMTLSEAQLTPSGLAHTDLEVHGQAAVWFCSDVVTSLAPLTWGGWCPSLAFWLSEMTHLALAMWLLC